MSLQALDENMERQEDFVRAITEGPKRMAHTGKIVTLFSIAHRVVNSVMATQKGHPNRQASTTPGDLFLSYVRSA